MKDNTKIVCSLVQLDVIRGLIAKLEKDLIRLTKSNAEACDAHDMGELPSDAWYKDACDAQYEWQKSFALLNSAIETVGVTNPAVFFEPLGEQERELMEVLGYKRMEVYYEKQN